VLPDFKGIILRRAPCFLQFLYGLKSIRRLPSHQLLSQGPFFHDWNVWKKVRKGIGHFSTSFLSYNTDLVQRTCSLSRFPDGKPPPCGTPFYFFGFTKSHFPPVFSPNVALPRKEPRCGFFYPGGAFLVMQNPCYFLHSESLPLCCFPGTRIPMTSPIFFSRTPPGSPLW